jgi:hypothetical protein
VESTPQELDKQIFSLKGLLLKIGEVLKKSTNHEQMEEDEDEEIEIAIFDYEVLEMAVATDGYDDADNADEKQEDPSTPRNGIKCSGLPIQKEKSCLTKTTFPRTPSPLIQMEKGISKMKRFKMKHEEKGQHEVVKCHFFAVAFRPHSLISSTNCWCITRAPRSKLVFLLMQGTVLVIAVAAIPKTASAADRSQRLRALAGYGNRPPLIRAVENSWRMFSSEMTGRSSSSFSRDTVLK